MSIEDMIELRLPEAVHAPCVECPWRRESCSGWLGPYTPQQWASLVSSDQPIACHRTITAPGSWEGAAQCAGAAAYRANVGKQPRVPGVAVGPRRDDVFASPMEFMEHHTL